MPLDRKAARERLQKSDFTGLFTQELGWDWHTAKLPVTISGQTFDLTAIAHKRGFVVWHCPAPAGGKLPDSALRRRLEREATKAAHEHLIIFTDDAKTLQVWQWVRREPGKPLRVRETLWSKGQSGEVILQKLDPLFVSLDDEEALTLLDITGRAGGNVDERVTKKFYEEFRKQHAAFVKFIDGIPNQGDHEWYASVMLNRLMFLYFIQRKGFLDGDRDYLRNRLNRVKNEQGEDKFYRFYRHFLIELFHNGLGSIKRTPAIENLLGRVPYLNGGIFDVHKLERTKAEGGYGRDIQIPDKAFEAIFDYFDRYQWHLDERPLRDDREINPDVLGYIFEKYINQKQMGAYYTKEDITEYIGKNTILPFLFDAVKAKVKSAFEGENSVWALLRRDPDRYIHPAVRHGLSWDYQPAHPQQGEPLDKEVPLPADIAAGLDPKKPDLVARRKCWNKPAPATHGLPTEIWRETVARRQRCADLRAKLAAGEVQNIADLITLNLDIRQFALDVITGCDSPELLAAIWHTLAGRPARKSSDKPQHALTILDPTCGSGAFIFAALNILAPLYEACLDRMEGMLADARATGAKIHPDSHLAEFERVIEQVGKHHNERYFIFKTIILNNLYGVDLMEEAVEICKLRLFLKLAAQVEPNEGASNFGIEPLPDIDFNIRAGNTLVGYATRGELEAVGEFDMLRKLEVGKALEAAEDAASAYDTFIRCQLDGDNPTEFKRRLIEKFGFAREQCNQFLAESYEHDLSHKPQKFASWKVSRQPFHWFMEFFGILNKGGFDVIIGNPPYVATGEVDYLSKDLKALMFPDIYALVLLRSLRLSGENGRIGMIVPLSLTFSSDFGQLRKALCAAGNAWFSSYDNIPAAVFAGVSQRCTIWIGEKQGTQCCSSPMYRWRSVSRPTLTQTLSYTDARRIEEPQSGIPKLYSEESASLLKSIHGSQGKALRQVLCARRMSKASIGFSQAARNFISVFKEAPPYLDADSLKKVPPSQIGELLCQTDEGASAALASLSGELYFYYWLMRGDGFHVTSGVMKEYLKFLDYIPDRLFNLVAQLGHALSEQRFEALVFKKNAGKFVGNFNYRGHFHITRRSDLLIMAGLGHDKLRAADLFDRVQRVLAINERAGEKAIPEQVKSKFPPAQIDQGKLKALFRDVDSLLIEHFKYSTDELDFVVNHDVQYPLEVEEEIEDATE